MTDETRNDLRARLEQERERVQRRVAGLRAAWRPEELEAGGDNTPLSEETDAAQVIEERETGTRLLDALVDRADELERSLRRLEDGTYGTCESCGRPIPPARLAARPEASLCVDCQEERERRDPDASRREPSIGAQPLD